MQRFLKFLTEYYYYLVFILAVILLGPYFGLNIISSSPKTVSTQQSTNDGVLKRPSTILNLPNKIKKDLGKKQNSGLEQVEELLNSNE